MLGKMFLLVQTWHDCYGSNQSLPDWTGSLLHMRESTPDIASMVKSLWLGRGYALGLGLIWYSVSKTSSIYIYTLVISRFSHVISDNFGRHI